MTTIIVQPSGTQIHIEPGETLLSGLHKAGYAYTVGCRRGGCRICKVDVVDGDFSYNRPVADSVVSEDERTDGERSGRKADGDEAGEQQPGRQDSHAAMLAAAAPVRRPTKSPAGPGAPSAEDVAHHFDDQAAAQRHQDQVVAGLKAHVEVRHEARLAGDDVEQPVVDLDAVERRQAEAR